MASTILVRRAQEGQEHSMILCIGQNMRECSLFLLNDLTAFCNGVIYCMYIGDKWEQQSLHGSHDTCKLCCERTKTLTDSLCARKTLGRTASIKYNHILYKYTTYDILKYSLHLPCTLLGAV